MQKNLLVQIPVYIFALFFLFGCVTTANKSGEPKTFARFVEKSRKPIELSSKQISELQRKCDDGSYTKCHALGMYYAQETDWNASLSVANFSNACEAGFNRACASLGGLYLGVRDLERDMVQALKFFRKACEGGYHTGCIHLGALYRKGDGVETDLERTGKLFERACQLSFEKGKGVACFYTGEFYLGEGSSLDGAAHTKAFFKQSCDVGTKLSCLIYQRISRDGTETGVLDNPPTRFDPLFDAIDLYQDLCNSGDSYACNGLGEMYAKGGKESRSQALESFQKSCDAGVIPGCFNLGLTKFRMSRKARYFKDLNKSLSIGFTPEIVELFKFSCDNGFAKGCEKLAPAYYAGKGGVKKDVNKYKELRRRACRLDEAICTLSSND